MVEMLLKVDNLLLLYGADMLLLSDTTLEMRKDSCYGAVGQYGAGKTTLMKEIVSGNIVGMPKHLKCVHVDDSKLGEVRKSCLRLRVPSPEGDGPRHWCHQRIQGYTRVWPFEVRAQRSGAAMVECRWRPVWLSPWKEGCSSRTWRRLRSCSPGFWPLADPEFVVVDLSRLLWEAASKLTTGGLLRDLAREAPGREAVSGGQLRGRRRRTASR